MYTCLTHVAFDAFETVWAEFNACVYNSSWETSYKVMPMQLKMATILRDLSDQSLLELVFLHGVNLINLP